MRLPGISVLSWGKSADARPRCTRDHSRSRRRGNVDPIDGRLPDELALVAGGLSIHVSHGHELGTPTPAKLLSSYSADILIYGHTHKALVERDGLRLVINPGAAGPRRFDLHPSVARLMIAGGRADVELVTLSA